ncbi:MAG: hypothetical protein Q4D42_07085 [Eubacteriales bacterium]|nr:hypothetical protein [Eubacteriales bacterium]
MNVYAKIIEIARRSNPDAIRHVYLSKNGKSYMFDDYGKIIGEYHGDIPCLATMPPEFEEQVSTVII